MWAVAVIWLKYRWKRRKTPFLSIPYLAELNLMTIFTNMYIFQSFNSYVDRFIYDSVAESAEQDQTARMCRLILLYSLRKVKFRTFIIYEFCIQYKFIWKYRSTQFCQKYYMTDYEKRLLYINSFVNEMIIVYSYGHKMPKFSYFTFKYVCPDFGIGLFRQSTSNVLYEKKKSSLGQKYSMWCVWLFIQKIICIFIVNLNFYTIWEKLLSVII